MRLLLGINIITHIIHHPWSQRYTPIASQLCAAWGYASNVRLRNSVFNLRITSRTLLNTSGNIWGLHIYLSTLPLMCTEDVCVQHIEKVCIIPKLLSWIHFTHITSPVQDYFVSLKYHVTFFFHLPLLNSLFEKHTSLEINTATVFLCFMYDFIVFILNIHSFLPPGCTHGAISTSASEVANLPLPVDNTTELWRWNRNLPFCQAINRW